MRLALIIELEPNKAFLRHMGIEKMNLEDEKCDVH